MKTAADLMIFASLGLGFAGYPLPGLGLLGLAVGLHMSRVLKGGRG